MKNISQLLSKYNVSTHYLNRYVKFISWCYINNFQNSFGINLYMEEHHILPKSKHLFPEYSDLRMFKWNSINLTYRQHYIAHWILSKVFIDLQQKSAMLKAFYRMSVTSTNHENKRLLSSKDVERCKIANSESMKINNPMHNVDIKNKAIKAMKQYYSIPENIEKIRLRRLGVNNISEEGIKRLSDIWKGVKRPKTKQHIINHKISSSIGSWITPFGSFYNPLEASKSDNNVDNISRHLIKKFCLIGINGFSFIPKTQK